MTVGHCSTCCSAATTQEQAHHCWKASWQLATCGKYQCLDRLGTPAQPDLVNASTLHIQHGSAISGPVQLPAGQCTRQLGALTALQHLVLSHNQITGSLPTFAGQLAASDVWLDSNALVGSLPTAWCDPVYTSTMHIQNNPGLCGEVPTCLQARVQGNPMDTGYQGTSLIRPDDPNGLEGGECNFMPPVCDPTVCG